METYKEETDNDFKFGILLGLAVVMFFVLMIGISNASPMVIITNPENISYNISSLMLNFTPTGNTSTYSCYYDKDGTLVYLGNTNNNTADTSTLTGLTEGSHSVSINCSNPTGYPSGLISYWKLDETNGLIANDLLGTNNGTFTGYTQNNGTLVNSPTWNSSGKNGYALTFNGLDNYVNITDFTNLSQPITVSLWWKMDSLKTDQKLLTITNNGMRFVMEHISTGTVLRTGIYNGSAYTGKSQVINDNEWHHTLTTITWTGTSPTVTTYLDGTAITGTSNPSASGTVGFKIGARTDNALTWNGSIDSVRIWNRALNSTEIAAEYNSGLGTAHPTVKATASWEFDEGTGTNAEDTNPWTQAKVGNSSAGFNKTSYIITDKVNLTSSSDGFAISFWLNLRNDANMYVMDLASVDDIGFYARYGSSHDLRFYVRNISGTQNIAYATQEQTLGGWHHIVGMTDYSTIDMYVDGILVNYTIFNGAPESYNQKLYIGTRGNGLMGINGSIDEVMIFNRSLSAMEISHIYNESYGRFMDTALDSNITTVGYTTDYTNPATSINMTASDGTAYINGTWINKTYVNISLTCIDGVGVGCNATLYCTDTANTCTPNTTYTATFNISTAGTSYVRYRSNDSVGNVEAPTNSRTIKIFSHAVTYDATVYETNATPITSSYLVNDGSSVSAWLNWGGTEYTATANSTSANKTIYPDLEAVNDTAHDFYYTYQITYTNGTKVNFSSAIYTQNVLWAYYPTAFSIPSTVQETYPILHNFSYSYLVDNADIGVDIYHNGTLYQVPDSSPSVGSNTVLYNITALTLNSETNTSAVLYSNASLNITSAGVSLLRYHGNDSITDFTYMIETGNSTNYFLNVSAYEPEYMDYTNFSADFIVKTYGYNGTSLYTYTFSTDETPSYYFKVTPTTAQAEVNITYTYQGLGYAVQQESESYSWNNLTGSLNETLFVMNGTYYTFIILDLYGNYIDGADISVYSYIYENITTNTISNIDGTVTLVLKPLFMYKINISATGYNGVSFDFIPGATTTITVRLSKDLDIGEYYYTYMADAFDYSCTSGNNSENFTMSCSVEDRSGYLKYARLACFDVDNAYNRTFDSNNTASSSTINASLSNLSKTYYCEYYLHFNTETLMYTEFLKVFTEFVERASQFNELGVIFTLVASMGIGLLFINTPALMIGAVAMVALAMDVIGFVDLGTSIIWILALGVVFLIIYAWRR